MVIISRFAPAPTGFLHLGHIVNAVYVWGMTRARQGRVLVRIEDHDRVRSRPEFEAAILEDLAWLGFVGDGLVTRQSERGEVYAQALDTLRQQGRVYACACSRAGQRGPRGQRRPGPSGRGAEAGPKGPAPQGVPDTDELWYPGTCRGRGLPEAAGSGIRVRLEPSTERFVDWRRGPQEQRPFEQCGDLLARDRDGNWTYQFAAAVDDFAQGVTLVIRGDDLLSSTGRQMQLARMLGRADPPAFLHHPLIMKSPTQKLSKSDRDSGVRDLRAKGWTPAQVIGQACMLAGLMPAPAEIRAGEVASLMATVAGQS